MKTNQEPESDAALNTVLFAWRVKTALPPSFQEQVWHRIARAEEQSRPGFGSILSSLLEFVLPRPKVAYAYLALLLALGVAAGSWTAQVKNSRLQTSLGSRYLQSVNPFPTASTNP